MKNHNINFQFESFVEIAPLFGIKFNEFSRVRSYQQKDLVDRFLKKSTFKINSTKYMTDFFVGGLDFLVYEDNGERKFALLEYNGSSNVPQSTMPLNVYESILNEYALLADHLTNETAKIIMPFYTKVNDQGIPTGAILYEKAIVAEYIKKGLQNKFGSAKIITLPEILSKYYIDNTQPIVVIGHINDFFKILSEQQGKLKILNQDVDVVLHDYAASSIIAHFDNKLDTTSFKTINSIYNYGSNKHLTYEKFNQFIKENKFKYINRKIGTDQAFNRDELVSKVRERVQNSGKIVIKPNATKSGLGIEFFVESMNEQEIISKIDQSINSVFESYQSEKTAFPYTINDFIDAATVCKPSHPAFKHKFEVRLFIFRNNDELKAFPSFSKVSSTKFDPENITRPMLLNTVSTSSSNTGRDWNDFFLCLTNNDNLDSLGISPDMMDELVMFATQFINYLVENNDV